MNWPLDSNGWTTWRCDTLWQWDAIRLYHYTFRTAVCQVTSNCLEHVYLTAIELISWQQESCDYSVWERSFLASLSTTVEPFLPRIILNLRRYDCKKRVYGRQGGGAPAKLSPPICILPVCQRLRTAPMSCVHNTTAALKTDTAVVVTMILKAQPGRSFLSSLARCRIPPPMNLPHVYGRITQNPRLTLGQN